MRKTLLHIPMLCLTLAVLTAPPAVAQESIALQFERTGTDASSVTTTVVDQDGAAVSGTTVTFESSHSLKSTANDVTSSILCPDVNGNTGPAIELTFTIVGLPTTFAYNTIGMDIHALNSSGKYQNNTDSGVSRQWNVDVERGTSASELSSWGTLSDIEIAYGVGSSGDVHKVWSLTNDESSTATDPLVVKLTITMGTTNKGCFFGLSSVELSTTEPAAPIVFSADSLYTIRWKANTTSYFTEGTDASLFVQSASVHARQQWQLIPTDDENVYYIRNQSTGRYVQSCNQTPSSDSRVGTGDDPVAYYIGQTEGTSADIEGCFWMSSTDCDGYDDETSGPRALNKDGASSNIITWQAGTSRVGSYWTIETTTDVYEPQPFTSSSEVGKPLAEYAFVGVVDTLGVYYFVGTDNAGGYQIVDAETHQPVESSSGSVLWTVWESASQLDSYYFLPWGQTTDTLVLNTDSIFTLVKQRSSFARKMQIYTMPCGTINADTYVERLTVSGGPGSLVYDGGSEAPSSWYTLYTQSKGTAQRGDTLGVDLTLNQALLTGQQMWLYFDWDHDGLFELSLELADEAQSSVEVVVPDEAPLGKSRMRLRLTENALEGADEDVIGLAYDFIITVVETETSTGLTALSAASSTLSVRQESGCLTAQCAAPVQRLQLYSVDGRMVAQGRGSKLSIQGITPATYVLRAQTTQGAASTKLAIK